jgi:predicted metal-dependent HD superfamily phosphohydrolase
MQRLGLPAHLTWFEDLHDRYLEAHRHYHTGRHIIACLSELAATRTLAVYPEEVELALWFHDAIYDPTQSDNERQSADLAAQFLATANIPTESRTRIRSHILATTHHFAPESPDAALVVDIDLAILGQSEATYALFEQTIRQEYEWVPIAIYRHKRTEVLQSFLQRESIYSLPWFRQCYELTARRNVEQAIQSLDRL